MSGERGGEDGVDGVRWREMGDGRRGSFHYLFQREGEKDQFASRTGFCSDNILWTGLEDVVDQRDKITLRQGGGVVVAAHGREALGLRYGNVSRGQTHVIFPKNIFFRKKRQISWLGLTQAPRTALKTGQKVKLKKRSFLFLSLRPGTE